MIRIDYRDLNRANYRKEHREYLLEEAANAYVALTIMTKAFGLKEEKANTRMADIEALAKYAGFDMKEVRREARENLKSLKEQLGYYSEKAGSMLYFEKERNTKVSA